MSELRGMRKGGVGEGISSGYLSLNAQDGVLQSTFGRANDGWEYVRGRSARCSRKASVKAFWDGIGDL